MKIRPSWFIVLILGIFLLLANWGCAGRQRSESPRDQLAEAYGVDGFDQVEELRYTFNVKLPDRVISRSWSWEPKKDRVTFLGTAEQGGTVTYERSTLLCWPSQRASQENRSSIRQRQLLADFSVAALLGPFGHGHDGRISR